jgi:hypothetical protein
MPIITCPYTIDRFDDEGSKLLWNVGQLLQDYSMQHRRRQPSSSEHLCKDVSSANKLEA